MLPRSVLCIVFCKGKCSQGQQILPTMLLRSVRCIVFARESARVAHTYDPRCCPEVYFVLSFDRDGGGIIVPGWPPVAWGRGCLLIGSSDKPFPEGIEGRAGRGGIVEASLGPLRSVLGTSWGLLWVSWGPADGLGGPLGAKGSKSQFEFPIFGPSWGPLGALDPLGPSWEPVGRLGAILGAFGPSWTL